jgi:uncharacterized protein
MIELKVDDVLARVASDTDAVQVPPDPTKLAWHGRIILLKETHGERVFPVWTGAFEGDVLALAVKIQAGSPRLVGATSPPRPMPHDLMAELVRAMNGRVERVAITSFRETTYYATVFLAVDGTSKEVDARPSDALGLAVRTGAPIFVEERLLEEAGLLPTAAMEMLETNVPPGKWQSLLRWRPT